MDLVENVDYYINEKGLYVFTEHYLKARGHCCENGCLHCPYGFNKPVASQKAQENSKKKITK